MTPALSGNFSEDYFLQQSVAVLSQPSQHSVFSPQQAFSHSAFLSQSAHFSSVHFSWQHLSSQHSVFLSQHESVHSPFLLLQHEHEAAAIIAATTTIDINTFFIINRF